MKQTFFYRPLTITVLTLLAFSSLSSCKKENTLPAVPQITEESGDHFWYAFTRTGIERCTLPQKSNIQSLMPWTESLRVSDAAVDDEGNGFIIVNRLGVLTFTGKESPTLIQDFQLFRDTTAGSLVFNDGQAYFSLYKSSFFNKTLGAATDVITDAQNRIASNRAYLVRADSSSSMLFPVITYGDLGLSVNEEVSSTYFDGQEWFVSIKQPLQDKTIFRYGSWKPAKNMASMKAVSSEGKITFTERTEDDFRTAQLPRPFSKAPERLKKLLKVLPRDFGFSLVVHTANGASPRQFYSGEGGPVARALITDRAVCAVFEDGTTYFSGAVAGRELISDGKTVAFRLPKLNESYAYTDFILTGDYLVAGWEEQDFYKTGRSGLLMVDLAKVFYENKDASRDADRSAKSPAATNGGVK